MVCDLKDKITIVTGGGRGIGKEISRYFAQAGSKVVICSRNLKNSNETADEIMKSGGEALALQVDVASGTSVKESVQKVLDKYGRLDILVNNAGITRDGLLMRMEESDWDEVMAVNLKGAFHFIKAVLRPMMKQRSGRIVSITSIVGMMGNAGQANYAASKAGIIGLTKSIAKEVASRSITVNAIAPGFIDTDMTSQLSKERQDAMLKMIPLGRFGTPRDVAKLALFLCSDLANYITGEVIRVDGGMAMSV